LKPSTKNINDLDKGSQSSKNLIKEIENSEVQNSKIDDEQNSLIENNVITVQFFEDNFIVPLCKDSKRKLERWNEFMEKFFPDKLKSISFSELNSQFKLKPYSHDLNFNSPEEVKNIESFFNKYL